MKTTPIELPSMYADHHVTEVRRILLEIEGVEHVLASSAFQVAEVTYDPDKVSAEQLESKLAEAGYAGELPIPVESGEAAYHGNGAQVYFRHTAVYETTRQVVSFGQSVSYSGRPLWPCPGVGPLRMVDIKEE